MGALFPSSIRILSPKSRTVEDCAPPGFVKTSDVAATPVWPRFTDAGRDEVTLKPMPWVGVNTWCAFEEEGSAFRAKPLGEPVPPALPRRATFPA